MDMKRKGDRLNLSFRRIVGGSFSAYQLLLLPPLHPTSSQGIIRFYSFIKTKHCLLFPSQERKKGTSLPLSLFLSLSFSSLLSFLRKKCSFFIVVERKKREKMAVSKNFAVILSVLALVPLCFAASGSGYLYPQYYDHSCPKAKEIVKSIVAEAVAKEARMAASLLRLHFHDCFVKGCDASILLDSSGSIVSEKGSNPNRNSARGFEVIDKIKAALEKECPQTVSCADILTLAARDSTVLAGGPCWEVPLGRRDSLGASLSGSNNNIPAPNNTLPTIITKYKLKGLDLVDLVALSGSHTIGLSRCTSFRQRLYNQTGNGLADSTLEEAFASQLRSRCPRSGGDNNLFPLDFVSPTKFDNNYFKNIIASKGLLSSDQVLFTKSAATMALVEKYAENNGLFLEQFAKSMLKMGNITPLTGSKGEIRKNCRKVNS